MRGRFCKCEGFTLVELMIVVVIIGILAAVAVPAFSRHVKRSRSAEAAATLSRLWAGAVSYYASPRAQLGGAPLAAQFPGPVAPAESASECGCFASRLCPGGSAVWATPVWSALLFSMPDPHSYVPRFESSGVDQAAAFTARATADLDCDGIVQTFERTATIGAGAGEITGNSLPLITNANE